MEILIAFLLCTGVCICITLLVERRRTDITEVYIPNEDDTTETVREKLYDTSLRGSKIIICKSGKDSDEIIRRIAEEYGKIYKKE